MLEEDEEGPRETMMANLSRLYFPLGNAIQSSEPTNYFEKMALELLDKEISSSGSSEGDFSEEQIIVGEIVGETL